MNLHDTTLSEAPLFPRFRDVLAALLRAASRHLDHLALRLATRAAEEPADIDVEFYAEAGAPEGAVYVKGQLVGTLPGITRL